MPNSSRKVKSRPELLKNLRIVWLKDEKGMSFEQIAQTLDKEGFGSMKRQRVHQIYNAYKDVNFEMSEEGALIRYEDEQVIIH